MGGRVRAQYFFFFFKKSICIARHQQFTVKLRTPQSLTAGSHIHAAIEKIDQRIWNSGLQIGWVQHESKHNVTIGAEAY